jgi:hypothetical protein
MTTERKGHWEGRFWISEEIKPVKYQGLNITAHLKALAKRADVEGLTELQVLTEAEKICTEFRKPKNKWYGDKKDEQ